MLALRIFGAVFAVALLALSAVRYNRRAISRLNLIISWAVGAAVLLLAVAPVVFNPVFDAFNFRQGGGRRLIAAELFGLIALFALQLRTMSNSDQNERALRLLVEALAVETFRRERERLRESLPEGPCIVVVSPAYNEAENVAGVIDAIPEEIEGYPVVSIVVDDASEDATAEAAREAGAIVVRNPIRRGGGLALRVGG